MNCEAIPAAARRGWRDDVLCASTATSFELMIYAEPFALCAIHAKQWSDAGPDKRADLLVAWRMPTDPGATLQEAICAPDF